MNEQVSTPPTVDQLATCRQWWNTLNDSWKLAFNQVAMQRSELAILDDQILFNVYHSEAHRFAGPTAPYPNMNFELEDLSGIKDLPHAKIVVYTFHKLDNLKDISHLTGINSLFVYNNHLKSLEGIETLVNLKELYFNVNEVESLLPLAHLHQLQTIYCNYNKITSLEGVGEANRGTLKNFVCLPNDLLPDSEVIRMEREIGIRCNKG